MRRGRFPRACRGSWILAVDGARSRPERGLDAYGWPHDLTDEQILERLVALNAERAEEEKRGLVRWLRPDFQNPQSQSEGQSGGAVAVSQVTSKETEDADADDEDAREGSATAAAAATTASASWPKKLAEQLAAVRDLVARGSSAWAAGDVAAQFKGANAGDVEPVLESLAALGMIVAYDVDGAATWRAARTAAMPPAGGRVAA